MDPARPRASALLAADGKVVALDSEAGDMATSLGLENGAVEVVELGERVLIPGLTDAHHHFAQSAAQGYWVDVRPEVAPSVDEVVTLMANAPPGVWAIGWGADDAQQGRMPNRQELTEAVPDRPAMVIHASYHAVAVNDLALQAGGVSRSTPDPAGGKIERGRDGEATGILHDAAMTIVAQPGQAVALEDPIMDWAALADAHQERMLSFGFTHLCDACAPPEFEALYRRLNSDGALRLSMTVSPTGSGGFFVDPGDRLEGTPTGEVDGRLRTGALKVFMDGANLCALSLPTFGLVAAAARSAYRGLRRRDLSVFMMLADRSAPIAIKGGHVHRGEMLLPAERFNKLVKDATDRGFAVMTHALGNRTIATALDAYDQVPNPVETFRLEHVTITDPGIVRRLGSSPVHIATQPGFISLFPWLAEIPTPKNFSVVPVASLDAAGALVAFSTDQPSGEPDPWRGLAGAVSRLNQRGEPVSPSEAVGPERALEAFTRDAARISGYAGGVLDVGRPADMVMLNSDPLADGALAEETVRPESTWVDGELAWSRTGEHRS